MVLLNDSTEIAGTTFSVTCEAKGFPETISYIWEKQLDPSTGLYETVTTESTLSFSSITFTDDGQYRCVAMNDAGNNTQEITIAGIIITACGCMRMYLIIFIFTVPPVSPSGLVNISGEGNVLNEQQDVTFVCTVARENVIVGPGNNFTWTFDDAALTESDTTISITTTSQNSTLVISSINVTIHKGTYTCSVTNVGGTGTESITVRVIG